MAVARFEIVRTDGEQPWHARFRAANGRIVWTTEQYARRRDAGMAIGMLGGPALALALGNTEVRILDERTTP